MLAYLCGCAQLWTQWGYSVWLKMHAFQIYLMMSSPLQCWWLYWSLSCWQEQCGLHTRRAFFVFRVFPPLAVLITDKLAHIQSQREMYWSQTWVLTQENSTQRRYLLIMSPSGIKASMKLRLWILRTFVRRRQKNCLTLSCEYVWRLFLVLFSCHLFRLA